MKFSRLAGFAAILVCAGAGCVAAVSGTSTGTGGGGVSTGSGGAGPVGCGTGLTMCGSACVNTTGNASHCGGCNVPCASGQVCDNSVCGTTCSTGNMLCGSNCANVSTDPIHCGSCTTMCRSDQICTAGSCVCPAGQTLCGNGICAASCGGAGGSTGAGGTGGTTPLISCPTPMPGRAPLRRLTTFEYNNTVRDLLTDTTNPGNAFPAETLGDGFGNNADEQSVADSLAREYVNVAEGIAARATANATALGRLAACAGTTLAAANEEACARTIATSFLPRAYRRIVPTAEVDEHVALYRTVRALSTTLTFASGVAAILEAALQNPDFIYRVEFGTTDAANPSVKKLTGRELAARLSYFFWQTMPDAPLNTAADGNMLGTPTGVMTQATRLLDDARSRPMVAFFFDNILPLRLLTDIARDPAQFPTYTATIGQAMRQETQRALEFEIYENTTQVVGSPYVAGSWPAVLTAPYTFVNPALFNHYGAGAFAAGTSVTGTGLTKVTLNATQRMGLLTQGGIMTGTTTTNLTNPVLRGGFIMNKLMCRNISFPTDPVIAEMAMRPVPYTGWTARERYSKHSLQAVCAACHQYMDPVGLALENYDAVGLYRTVERATINGETRDTPIDTNGMVTGVGTWANAIELAQKLAASEEMQTCFSSHWMQFAYGRTLMAEDACNRQSVNTAFKNSGYNIKKMLLALTQADAFLYRPAQ